MKHLLLSLIICVAASPAMAGDIWIVDESGRLKSEQLGRLQGQAEREYEKLKTLFKADAGQVTLRVRAAGVGRHFPPATIHIPIHLIDKSTAITAHELTHLLTQGWASQLLKEGLAVYTQDRIGEQRGWPNYRRSVHGAARFWINQPGASVRGPGQADDALSTPRKGETRLRQTAYAVAGSWVKWIIETKLAGDVDKFMAEIYRSNRYKTATGQSFSDLARDWLVFIRS